MQKLALFTYIRLIICLSNSMAMPEDSIKKPLSVGGKIQYGIILPHSELIRPLAFNKPYGIELNFSRLNHSEKSVKQLNCYSYSGIAINYINFNHSKIGSSVNCWYYFEPLLKFQNRLSYGIRAGTGVSYLTKVYDEVTNPENKFFASHIAFLLMLELKIKFKLNKKVELTSSFCYNHISNGGIKQPNYGMNFPTFTLGADYHFHPIDLKPIEKTKITENEKIWQFRSETKVSVKVQEKTDEYGEKACFVYGFSAFANKRLSKFSALNIGLEYIDDGYIKEGLRRAGLDTDYRRAAGFVGHDLIFGQVRFTVNLGVYFYCPNKTKDPFYEKYMLQYSFGKRVYAGVYMLAHGEAADSMGFSLGYVIFSGKVI